jgi:acetate---CoA ligase (ADP-forming)
MPERPIPSFDFAGLINPKSIAIVGASAEVDGHAGRTLANLVRTGYRGEIFPVNPRHRELSGYRCYESVDQLPAQIDVAYLMLRAETAVQHVEQCAAHGIRTVVVCASGFAELGADGRRIQETVRDVARRYGSRVLGPNCIGVMNVADNVIACPTFNITSDLLPGTMSIVSQSGGMGVNIANIAQSKGIGVRVLVSVGNECDLELADMMDALIEDPATCSVVLVVEQVRDGARFVAAAVHARSVGKPVLALKLGRTSAGQRSALSHTGAMAGDYPVLQGVFRQLGIVETDSIDGLVTTANLLVTAPPVAGNRLAVLSPSGGECTYMADRASEAGLDLPDLSQETKDALGPLMPLGHPGNPLDPTGAVIGNSDLLRSALAALDADPAFDMIALAIPTWADFEAQRLLPLFIEAAQASRKPTVISAWTAGAMTAKAEQMLRESGTLYFSSADSAVRALSALHQYWSAPRNSPCAATSPGAELGPLTDTSEFQVKQFLAGQGIAVARETISATRDEVAAVARTMSWPLVAKLQCAGVVHKTELGLVRTSVHDEAQLQATLTEFDRLASEQGLATEGYLLAEQYSGPEIIVGGFRHKHFGPVVMVGAGGVWAERLADRSFRLCPLSPDEARRALGELRISSVLSGGRGQTFDVDALAALVARVSDVMARNAWIAELDLNPVIVGASGAVAVDAVLIKQP